MITLLQIKAARALLEWKQETLAQKSGLSLPSINNLERGLYSPRKETLEAIKTALENAGVEFSDGSGVRLAQQEYSYQTFEGKNFIADLDEDIMSVLQGPEDEIIGVLDNERHWITYASVTNPLYIKAREKRGWKERFIIPNNAGFIISPPSSYRTIDPSMIGSLTYEIYGDRLALIMWESMRVTLIKNISIATNFKLQFDVLWNLGKSLTNTQLNSWERFDCPELKKPTNIKMKK